MTFHEPTDEALQDFLACCQGAPLDDGPVALTHAEMDKLVEVFGVTTVERTERLGWVLPDGRFLDLGLDGEEMERHGWFRRTHTDAIQRGLGDESLTTSNAFAAGMVRIVPETFGVQAGKTLTPEQEACVTAFIARNVKLRPVVFETAPGKDWQNHNCGCTLDASEGLAWLREQLS